MNVISSWNILSQAGGAKNSAILAKNAGKTLAFVFLFNFFKNIFMGIFPNHYGSNDTFLVFTRHL